MVLGFIPFLGWAKGRQRVPLLCFSTTMAELVTMNIESILLLGLVDGIWGIIAPIMFFERGIATVGASIIILALANRLPLGIVALHLDAQL